MAYLDRIAACNAHDPAGFRPFEVAGRPVGHVRHRFADRLAAFPDVLHVTPERVTLDDRLHGFEERSAALDTVLRRLAAEGWILGWRDEPYPVTPDWHTPPLLRMERAAVPHFGVRAFGVHLNGYVRDGDLLSMWIARRARDKPTWPGMLDNMVAGGQPWGAGIMANLVKECAEEAGIPPGLAARARPVGTIAYVMEIAAGLKPDVMFCFDLELPADFVPHNGDGEVESFGLLPIEEVARIVRETADFKPNCDLVVIDFLVRHGLMMPDDEPDYAAICAGLRRYGVDISS